MQNEAQTINSPDDFAWVFLKILNKQKRLIPFQWNRAQAHFHANRTGRDLILKARQLGFSTLIQGEMFRRVVTATRSTMTLAHDADTTQKLRLMADRFYQYCKFGDIQPLRKYASASLTTYPEFDSTVSVATAGNIEAGRGGTYTDFHGSEVAFWKDAERIIAGAMQGGNPDVILESTPNGAQGFFYEKCMEALHGNSVWTLHFYPWWWDDGYRIPVDEDEGFAITDEEAILCENVKKGRDGFILSKPQLNWRREKIRELGRLFTQEYPEDVLSCFLTSGNSYFGDLTGVFTAPMGAKYNPDHEYIAGLDFGQTDYTAMPVFDKTVKCQVDLLHINKMEWAEQRARIKQKYKYWHLKSVLGERNSIGSPNIEALLKDGVRVIPFDTTNESKAGIMSEMHEALHSGWKLLDIPAQKHEFNTFVSTQLPSGIWRLAADGEGHDDIVMGDALAIRHGRMSATIPEKQLEQKSKWQEGEAAGRFRKY